MKNLLASPKAKRILKSVKREPIRAFNGIENYNEVVDIFNIMSHKEASVTDAFRTTGAVKKGLDRAIKKSGYPMRTSVQKGKVVITK